MASDNEVMAQLDEELKKLGVEASELESGYGSPEPSVKDTIIRFFRDILHAFDSTKTGNLTDRELGQSRLSLRSHQELALYAEAEGLPVVAEYMMEKGNIIPATSMSRKGFFMQLVVTQIKKEQKFKDQKPEKKPWFGKRTEEDE